MRGKASLKATACQSQEMAGKLCGRSKARKAPPSSPGSQPAGGFPLPVGPESLER